MEKKYVISEKVFNLFWVLYVIHTTVEEDRPIAFALWLVLVFRIKWNLKCKTRSKFETKMKSSKTKSRKWLIIEEYLLMKIKQSQENDSK